MGTAPTIDPGHVRIERRKLTDIIPADYNPRAMTKNERAGLDGSLNEFGLVQPPVWNERTGRLVGGHQRHDWVLRQEGVEEVDVVVVDLSEEDERALNVTLNNPHIAGRFTDDLEAMLAEQREGNERLYKMLRFDVLNKRFNPGTRKPRQKPDLRDVKVFDHRCVGCGFEWNES